MNTKELQQVASKVRVDIVKAIFNAGSGHPGGSLSAADIVTALYFDEMNIDPKNPKWEVYKDAKGEFRFRLKASNGEIIVTGEGYKAKDGLMNGIESIKKNAPDAKVE